MNRRSHRSRISHERWLVSYADFITLLFAFFVVLYAFAKADEAKQVEISAAISAAFQSLGLFPGAALHPTRHSHPDAGTNSAAPPMNIVVAEEMVAPPQIRQNLEKLQHQLEQTLTGEIARHTIDIHMGRDGLVISLREAGFFQSGSADPRPGTLGTLRQIAQSLGKTGYEVRIEGHTDNVPIHNSQFDSNWELSTARATGIARLFLQLHAIPPDHLSAAGYAEYHPVASNATAEGRAMNRRVDLVVMPRLEYNFSAPQNPAAERGNGPWYRITDGETIPKPSPAHPR
jgi:chemotaxis protein MotB